MSDSKSPLAVGGVIAVVISITIAVTAITQLKSQLMAKDVQSALEKGVNPIAVRCAYASENDRICLVYAATRSSDKSVEMVSKSK